MERTGLRGRRLLLPLSFLCLAVLLATASSLAPATAGRKRRMAGFDHYVLALQWPGTVCRQTNHCCSSNGCCRWAVAAVQQRWVAFMLQTNHPVQHEQDRDAEDNTGEVLAVPVLRRFFDLLRRKGPVLGPRVGDAWDVRLPGDTGRVRLLLHRALPLQQVQRHALRKAKIYPRNNRKYEVSQIVNAIDHAFGRLPHLVCKNGSVQELRLCFHKDYQPRDCGSEADEPWSPSSSSSSRRRSQTSHCPRYVSLPSYKQSNATEGGALRNRAGNGVPRAHGQIS